MDNDKIVVVDKFFSQQMYLLVTGADEEATRIVNNYMTRKGYKFVNHCCAFFFNKTLGTVGEVYKVHIHFVGDWPSVYEVYGFGDSFIYAFDDLLEKLKTSN